MTARKHFLDISDFDAATLNAILHKARAMKACPRACARRTSR